MFVLYINDGIRWTTFERDGFCYTNPSYRFLTKMSGVYILVSIFLRRFLRLVLDSGLLDFLKTLTTRFLSFAKLIFLLFS